MELPEPRYISDYYLWWGTPEFHLLKFEAICDREWDIILDFLGGLRHFYEATSDEFDPLRPLTTSYIKVVIDSSILYDLPKSARHLTNQAIKVVFNKEFNQTTCFNTSNYTKSIEQLSKIIRENLPEPMLDLDQLYLNKESSLEVVSTRSIFADQVKDKDLLNKGIYDHRYTINAGLVLPSDTSIHIVCGSKDVIHSWAMPGLLIKIDCIPGFNSHRRVNLK